MFSDHTHRAPFEIVTVERIQNLDQSLCTAGENSPSGTVDYELMAHAGKQRRGSVMQWCSTATLWKLLEHIFAANAVLLQLTCKGINE